MDVPITQMNWQWRKTKLGCRIREESGNPAADEIREQLSKLTGVEHPGLLKKKDNLCPLKKGRKLGDDDGEDKYRRRGKKSEPTKNLGSMMAYEKHARQTSEAMPLTRRNINKKYFNVPWNPPKKVLRDVQRDRIRLAIPEAFRDDTQDHIGVQPRKEVSKKVIRSRYGQRRHHHRDDDSKKNDLVETDNEPNTMPFKAYAGDLFGTRGEYMGGIIYQSRLEFFEQLPNGQGVRKHILSPKTTKDDIRGISRSTQPTRSFDTHQDNTLDIPNKPAADRETTTTTNASPEVTAKKLCQSQGGHLDEDHPYDDDTFEKDSVDANPTLGGTKDRRNSATVDAKLHCASSLATWSSHPENVTRLAEEGAVAAALVLSKEPNLAIRQSCATALRRMSEHPKLCEQLIECAAVPIISDLGVGTEDMDMSRDCGMTLVNLTHCNGAEPKLVEDGIVIAFMSLMNQHEAELSDMCSRGLFNLTCVDEPYQYMERVMKAFIALASSTSPSVKHVCAAALCNLSDIKPIRGRIVEEGVVQIIGVLARGAEARTRRVCAIILHLLASTKQCRSDMVSKGTVQVLYSLSSDVDTITLHYIASAIIKLAIEEQNLPRLVHEGGVTALCNICLRCPHDAATTQLCASALSLLSQQGIGRQAIVQEGCVPAIVTLLDEATDAVTIRNGLGAFTNLLMDEANHDRVLAQGGISAVIELCGHSSSDIREACALALFNFSRGESSRDASVSAAAVPALIALSRLPEARTRIRCAATLCKLASVEQNVPFMVEADVVPAFIEMLRTSNDEEIVKQCCAALCRLAHEGTSATMIAEGAVPYVITGCKRGSDPATREACCAVLSAVSAHEPCRQPLCAMGVLQALMEFATDRGADDTTRLRCAVAFANLSNESTVRKEMVDAGIVPVLADLSNSYCEENQLYCARALCNLGCSSGSEDAIVQEGGVAALMMISMVRAVSHFTKQVCANALLNLMSPPGVRKRWLKKLAEDGLVQAVSVLSRLDEEETMNVCAKIFCIVSTENSAGRRLLVERRSTLKDVFALMRSKEHATRLVCGKTACNLLGHDDSQTPAVDAGAVSVLSALCNLGDPEAEAAAASAFFLVAGQPKCREDMVSSAVLPVLLQSTRSHSLATRTSCLQVLGHLAWSGLRAPLVDGDAVSVLVDLAGQVTKQEYARGLGSPADLVVQTLVYLSFAPVDRRPKLVASNVISALSSLYQYLTEGGSSSPTYARRIRGFVAAAVRSLAENDAAHDDLVNDGGVDLLCALVSAASSQKDDDATIILEHCASTISKLARRQRYGDVLTSGLGALAFLGQVPSCYAHVAAILHVLSIEAPHRELLVATPAIPNVLATIVEASDDPLPSSTAPSCAQTLYWWSKCPPTQRDDLAAAGIVTLLIRLSRSDDPKVASSCSEAMKNFSSDVSGGIEEGTVSTLIAMTLDNGKISKNTELEQRVFFDVPASSVDESRYVPADELIPRHALAAFRDYPCTTGKVPGGTAGAGPAPPEPPDMDVQDPLSVAHLENACDTNLDNDDSDTLASMMFAKMSVSPP